MPAARSQLRRLTTTLRKRLAGAVRRSASSSFPAFARPFQRYHRLNHYSYKESHMDRRHLVSGGLLAGLAGAFGFPSAAAGAQQRRDEGDERVATAVDELRKVVDRGLDVSSELAKIREQ